MTTTELREAQNNVEIIGSIKKIELEEKNTKSGRPAIMGTVTVEVKENPERIHNIKVKVFSFKLKKDGSENGLYKGYSTVKNEYKPGDRVKVTGSLTINEYYGQNGNLVSFNEVKAVFFNRLEGEEANIQDRAIATLEMVVKGMETELNQEGIPTGDMNVDAFTVGYNSSIIPLIDLKVGQALAQTFQGMYYAGSTGRITIKINNYATLMEEEVQTQQAGFGAAERVESNVVTNYTNNLEIIGGDLPYTDGVNNYSPQQIEDADKIRALALQQLQQNASAPATPQHTGFGNTTIDENKQKEINDAVDKMTNAFAGNTSQSTNNIPSF